MHGASAGLLIPGIFSKINIELDKSAPVFPALITASTLLSFNIFIIYIIYHFINITLIALKIIDLIQEI